MKNQDKATIGAILLVAIIIIYYYGSQFVTSHPYWSLIIFVLIASGIAILIKKSIENPELREKEKTILSFIFDAIKNFVSQSSRRGGEKKVRIPIPDDVKNAVMDRAGDKCQICSEDVSLKIHHIDGNPSNNSLNNLIVLCGVDHDKADKGVIPKWRLKNVINKQKTAGYISVIANLLNIQTF